MGDKVRFVRGDPGIVLEEANKFHPNVLIKDKLDWFFYFGLYGFQAKVEPNMQFIYGLE